MGGNSLVKNLVLLVLFLLFAVLLGYAMSSCSCERGRGGGWGRGVGGMMLPSLPKACAHTNTNASVQKTCGF